MDHYRQYTLTVLSNSSYQFSITPGTCTTLPCISPRINDSKSRQYIWTIKTNIRILAAKNNFKMVDRTKRSCSLQNYTLFRLYKLISVKNIRIPSREINKKESLIKFFFFLVRCP